MIHFKICQKTCDLYPGLIIHRFVTKKLDLFEKQIILCVQTFYKSNDNYERV